MFKIRSLLVALLLACPAVALAQDAGATAPVASAITDPGADLGAFAGQLVEAAKAKNYQMLAAALLVGLVFLCRRFGKSVPKVGPWMVTDRGGAVMSLLLGVLGGVAASLASGKGFNLHLLLDGVVTGFTAAGGYAVVKKILAPSDKAPVGDPAAPLKVVQ